jgi:hypothetical protein
VLSRASPTSLVALAFGAFAVASGIYLILDLSAPYSGLFRVPTRGLQQTIEALDNCAPRCERAGDRAVRDREPWEAAARALELTLTMTVRIEVENCNETRQAAEPTTGPSIDGSSLFDPLRSSTFRRLGSSAVDIFRGSALLFGISSLALPAWDQRMRRPNLVRVLIAPGAIDTRTQANSPHPSSREGHLSASRQNSNSETPPCWGHDQFDFRSGDRRRGFVRPAEH